MATEKMYDIVILGATGYTGRCAVEHVYTNIPTNVKWAVAGRSQQKLGDLIDQLQRSHPDRQHPGIEIVELNDQDLDRLAKKTRAIINAVGPYHMYSTPVVEACAINGTHYFDVTGETPWYYDILQKYEKTAKGSGAIIVPAIGLESFPTDIIAYLAATRLRQVHDTSIQHLTSCVYRLRSGGLSHGTTLTALTLTKSYPLSHLHKTLQPYSLSSTSSNTPKTPSHRPLLSRLLGPFSLSPFPGYLTTSPTSTSNICVSHRTSCLLSPALYSPSFRLEEYLRVPNLLLGTLAHITLTTLSFLILLPPIRWLLIKLLVTSPGSGPTDLSNRNSFLDIRGLGIGADTSPLQNNPQKVLSRLTYNSHMYQMSGVLMVECAMSVLNNDGAEKVRRKRFGSSSAAAENDDDDDDKGQGGILTGACLAESTDLLDRLKNVGFTFEVEDFDG